MAELTASLVVGPLVSLLKAKVSNYLLEQYNVMEGMEKQHRILKRKLPAILDIMADAEKQASRRGGVKAWLDELKTVAYQANNVFDEFEYEALRRRAKKEGHITKLGIMAGVKLFPTHNRIAFRRRMGKKLSCIVEAIKVLVDEMNDFGFHKIQLEAPAWKEWRQTDSIIVDHDIVSRSRRKEKEKIVKILLDHQASSSGDFLVLPIVGMGGLGKTTLAQLIYNDPQVKNHFQLLKWVCVSDDFNICNLANKICNATEKTVEEALKKLQEHLRGKRYLLVLDDVWNKEVHKWEKMKACLKQGGVGSAVLTTTRDKEIAEFMSTVANNSWKNKYHDVAILDIKFIHEIIETRAFSLQKTKPEELVMLVGPIAERCVGSPLAAKALGSVLRNKTTKKEWENILHRSRICDDETGILPILKLSYNDLPIDMKQCFAFCAMYPKNYQIDVDKLIQLWMANGYISDQNKVTAETMGKQIVNEMISRSFFQYEEQRRIGYSSISFIKIHDLMHDVALSASEEECVCITDEFIRSGELIPSAVRHIQFQRIADKKRLNFLFGTMMEMFPPIQTMMFDMFYYGEGVLNLSKYSSLRALSIPRSRPHLSIIPKHLSHLRYLDLSYNYGIRALPGDISILYSLQTLKLSGCKRLKRLPKQLKYMTSLRHMYTDGCLMLKCMPPGIGQLTSLRTITCFVLSSGSDCSGVGELKDLNIGGSLMLKNLENVRQARNAMSANLGNKMELRELSLRWTSGKHEQHKYYEVLKVLKPHDGLLSLEIYSYQGTKFPSWMGMLKNIVELHLIDCRESKKLPPLCHLPELQLLELSGLEKLQFLSSRYTSSTFRKLKDLKIVNLYDLNRFCQVVQGEAVAFPQLEILHIHGCKKLTALEGAFPELKDLKLIDLCSLEIQVEQQLFPFLDTVYIDKCPRLTNVPRAAKLRVLDMRQGNQHISSLQSCAWFGQLQDLTVHSCNELVYWPQKEFQNLVSLRMLEIKWCRGLIGYSVTCAHDRATSERSQLLPRLESITIVGCENLVEVFSAPALKKMYVAVCDKLESISGKQQDKTTGHQGFSTDAMASRDLSQIVRDTPDLLPSSLESLTIRNCHGLTGLHNLSSSLREVVIMDCSKLQLLSGQLDAPEELKVVRCPELRSLESCVLQLQVLETLVLDQCKRLASLPSGPQDYRTLRILEITGCPGIKKLPMALQHQVRSGFRNVDAHHRHQGTHAGLNNCSRFCNKCV